MCSNTLIRLNGRTLNNVTITVNLPTTTTNGITTLVLSRTRRVNRQMTRGCTSLVQGLYLTTRPPQRLRRRQFTIIHPFKRTMTFLRRGYTSVLVRGRFTRTILPMSVSRVPVNTNTTLRGPSPRTLLARPHIPATRPLNGIFTILHLVTRRSNNLRTYRRQQTLFSRRNLGVALRNQFSSITLFGGDVPTIRPSCTRLHD